ncbi:MAG: tRNA (N6-threonylcarbamoyladenosine(37)-N6)-methyltransferase TrmO [Lentisphaeria bacterium]|nr:tRNA (N6-threonylcarbamoyladenosine(37)-N6)-methyltransferase TrmO [Lentisphaeria bacterium]
MEIPDYNFKAIGLVRGGGKFPQQAPRQSVYARNEGFVELFPNCNYEQALEDLEGFQRIWLLFVFDRNTNWKPKVMPPYGIDRKVGTFASRSPYRPNPVGLSAVELVKIEGLRVFIRNFDLLDGTPILDIKPYIPEADSFSDSKAGWRDMVPDVPELVILPEAQRQINKLLLCGGPDLGDVARIQLTLQSGTPARQRISGIPGQEQILGYRTWRIRFVKIDGRVTVKGLYSGYTKEELAGTDDPYCDKKIHRDFLASL